MIREVIAAALVLGGVLSPAGCGETAPAAPDAGVAGGSVQDVYATPLIGERAPPTVPYRVELVEAGREPRRTYRYRVAAGSRQRIHRTSEHRNKVFVAGRPIYTNAIPPIHTTFELRIDHAAGGTYECSFIVVEAQSADWEQMAPGRGRDITKTLSKLRGHRIGVVVDDRGVRQRVDLTIPEAVGETRDLALNALRDMPRTIVPMPAEPVGPGARWKEIVEDPTGAVELAGPITVEYGLVAAAGDRLTLSMAVTLPPEPQPFEIGRKRFQGYTGGTMKSRGTLTIDLHKLLPLALDEDTEFDIEGRAIVGAEMPFSIHGVERQRIEGR